MLYDESFRRNAKRLAERFREAGGIDMAEQFINSQITGHSRG
jgi:UDP:flavonoid glycosyltransferase YjiC (YdhE family)